MNISLAKEKTINLSLLNGIFFIREMVLISPVILIFFNENGLTSKDLFLFTGIFYLVSILFELPAGWISDFVKKKYILFCSYIILLLGNLFWYLFQGYLPVLFGEICFSISKILFGVAASSYIFEYLNSIKMQDKMKKYWGYTNFYLAGGTVAAAIIGTALYSKFGSNNVLFTQILFISFSIMALLFIKSVPSAQTKKISKFSNKVKNFYTGIIYIHKSKTIKYYMLYSSILTAMSIFFALCFQPLMKISLFPIWLFGGITFINHFVRALTGIIAAKVQVNKITVFVKPLFILYICSFIFMLIILYFKNMLLTVILLTIICLIIGIQLLFTILYTSKLHQEIEASKRGFIISINNFIPKVLSAIIFLLAGWIKNNTVSISLCLIFFVISASILVFKIYKNEHSSLTL